LSVEVIKQVSKTFFEPLVKERESCRGLVVKDGKLLLSYESNKDVYMSPGGGLELGETLEKCCEREVLEETGVIVKACEQLCTIKEYVFDELYIAHYFLCEIVGKGESSLTKTEIEHGMEPRWVELEKAIEIFSKYSEKNPDHESLYLREYTVLNKYINK
jgi:ADP-ribose pyrophosphatase YjhB (NUDIX family)